MNNDYERYDFWFRETVKVNETKEEVIESDDEFDENDSKKMQYILNITQNFI